MAEKQEQSAAPQPAAGPKKKPPVMLIGVIAGIALLQGGVLFAVFKFMGGGPRETQAAQHEAEIEAEAIKPEVGVAEVQLLKGFRVPNDKSGRMIVFDMDVSIVVPADKVEAVKKITTERAGEVADRIARVLRSATDSMMREDNLTILRSLVETELKELLGSEDMLERVLFPRFVPIPV